MSSDMVEDKALPTECYLEALVSFLDAIKYDEYENERIEYIETLRYTYTEAAKHFAQPLVQESLNHNVHDFPGSDTFPVYVRRLSGLGQHVGGSLFPAEQFDEQILLSEIATAIAQVEHVVCHVNDLMSSCKEHGERHDQTNLIRTRCRVEGISLNEALERLTYDTISACEEMLAVFEGRN
ncbi:MAG: hypothetical protein Q9191_001764 [Dirinaria sp. TL-2023a]